MNELSSDILFNIISNFEVSKLLLFSLINNNILKCCHKYKYKELINIDSKNYNLCKYWKNFKFHIHIWDCNRFVNFSNFNDAYKVTLNNIVFNIIHQYLYMFNRLELSILSCVINENFITNIKKRNCMIQILKI